MAHFLCHLGCSHFGALLLDFYFTENTHCFYADVDNASITKTMEIAMDASLEKIKYTRAILNPIK